MVDGECASNRDYDGWGALERGGERRGKSEGAQRLAHTGKRRVEERALVKEGSGKKDRKGWDSEEGYLFG